MKRLFALCLMAGAFAGTAQAQSITSKSVCMRNCAEIGASPRDKAVLDEKLAALHQKQSQETDPQAGKRLANEEKDLLADYEDKVEQTCSYICEFNPER